MWAQAIGAGLSFFSGNKQAKQDAKDKKKAQQIDILGQRQNAQFVTEQEHYYEQLKRQEALRGIDQFRQFSTVSSFAPQYKNTNPNPIVLPAKPVYNEGIYASTEKGK